MADSYSEGLAITSQFYYCGLPLRLDTYPHCSMGCAYCFAAERGGNRERNHVLGYSAKSLRRRLSRLTEGRSPESAIDEMLVVRQPIHFGGMSDPFTLAAIRTGETLALLEVLAEFNYPTVISTKSAFVSQEPSIGILKRGTFIVQFSFSTPCKDTSKILEPRASSPADRMEAVRALVGSYIPTTLRLQPVLPGHENSVDSLIEEAGDSGVFHVAAEFLKVGSEASQASRARLNRGVGIDVAEHYKKAGARYIGREYVLPIELRFPHHQRWRELAHSKAMTYGFADLDLLHLSDGRCCCSGIDAIQGFQGFNRFTITEATKTAMELKAPVRIEHIVEYFTPRSTISHWVNSRVRRAVNTPAAPIEAYIRHKWLTYSSHLTPAMFQGIERDQSNPEQFIVEVDEAH